jgi:hypothetical protein
MVPAAILAAAKVPGVSSIAGKVAPAGFGINTIRGLGGGAKRDADRQARLTRYENGVKAGSVTAGQYIFGQRDECKNEHERDWYDASIVWLTRDYPDVMNAARARPKLHEPDDDATVSATAIEAELNNLYTAVRGDVAETVQRVGSGATTAATNAVAPDGSPLKKSFLLPTNWMTIAVVVVLIVGAFLFVKGRR